MNTAETAESSNSPLRAVLRDSYRHQVGVSLLIDSKNGSELEEIVSETNPLKQIGRRRTFSIPFDCKSEEFYQDRLNLLWKEIKEDATIHTTTQLTTAAVAAYVGLSKKSFSITNPVHLKGKLLRTTSSLYSEYENVEHKINFLEFGSSYTRVIPADVFLGILTNLKDDQSYLAQFRFKKLDMNVKLNCNEVAAFEIFNKIYNKIESKRRYIKNHETKKRINLFSYVDILPEYIPTHRFSEYDEIALKKCA